MKSNNLINLMIGQSLANIGDVLYIVSIISIIYKLNGSAAAVSIVPFTITLAMFVSSLMTPLLLVRVTLKTLMLWSQLGKTFIMFGLGFFMMKGINPSNNFVFFPMIAAIALLDGCAI
ncbi:MFS transporter [Peribacillus glennii]|uniref:hypothetical protein n=1 Tax=Peribacillus glennii TaxID=2303991 RepID=UPI00268CF897|nr:hypothetical protein [Peribacillus glennii]